MSPNSAPSWTMRDSESSVEPTSNCACAQGGLGSSLSGEAMQSSWVGCRNIADDPGDYPRHFTDPLCYHGAYRCADCRCARYVEGRKMNSHLHRLLPCAATLGMA